MKRILISILIAVTAFSCSADTNSTIEGEDAQTTQTNVTIENTKWALVKLGGQTVDSENDIYFSLNKSENRIEGSTGCNTINGAYKLEEGSRLSFDKVSVTLMLCDDTTVNETDFLEVFNLTDNYTLNENVLSLNVGRRAPLAVFERAKK
jgi:heat shock protein HslJ